MCAWPDGNRLHSIRERVRERERARSDALSICQHCLRYFSNELSRQRCITLHVSTCKFAAFFPYPSSVFLPSPLSSKFRINFEGEKKRQAMKPMKNHRVYRALDYSEKWSYKSSQSRTFERQLRWGNFMQSERVTR